MRCRPAFKVAGQTMSMLAGTPLPVFKMQTGGHGSTAPTSSGLGAQPLTRKVEVMALIAKFKPAGRGNDHTTKSRWLS